METNNIIKTYGTAGMPFCKCDKCNTETHCTNYKTSDKYDVFKPYCKECESKFIIGRYKVNRGIFKDEIFFGYKLKDRIINIKTIGQSYPQINCIRLNSIIG